MKRYKRTDRVSSLIHRELSRIIDMEFEYSGIGMVTVTGVEVSPDLRNAKVFVSVLGDKEETDRALETLNNAAGQIRAILAERIVLKYLPELRFSFDPSTVDGMRMDRILDEIKREGE